MIKIPANYYTVIAAEYALPDHSAMVVLTQEAGAVMISERDNPLAWTVMQQQSEIQVAPYVDRSGVVKPVADPNGGPDVVA